MIKSPDCRAGIFTSIRMATIVATFPRHPVTYSNTTSKPIPDQTQITSQINIDSLGTVANVKVTVDITHSYVGDLELSLVSPSGKEVKLSDRRGGTFDGFHNLTFADSAARSISTIGVNDTPYSGSWQPETPLSARWRGFGRHLDARGYRSPGIRRRHAQSLVVESYVGQLFRTTDEDGFYEFDNLKAGTYVVREDPQPGSAQKNPETTDIPAAAWADSQWTVTVVGIDDFSEPDGPDSHRNVVDVDFGNYAPLAALQGTVYRDQDGNSSKAPAEPGLAGWTVFVDLDSSGSLDTDVVDDTVDSDSAVAINNSAVVNSKIWFGELASITDVNVGLNITHTYDADLTATLISPTGTRGNCSQELADRATTSTIRYSTKRGPIDLRGDCALHQRPV